MNDVDYRSLAEQYGTPLYVYQGDMIESRYRLLRGCLPESFEVFYSVKCNPLLGVCQLFRELGSGIEVASLGELRMALQAGFKPGDIIFTSPGKSAEELEAAVDLGIYSINVESVEEARRINAIAGRRNVLARISARINPNFNFSGAGMKMTGVPTQFGIDQSEIAEAMDAIQALPFVSLIGIHVFTGTQMLDADLIVRNFAEVMKLAVELSEAHDFALQFLDLGGGFGVPYFQGEQDLDTDKLRLGLSKLWEQYGEKLRGARIGVESGRFLLAESGVFLTKVLYVKNCKGAKYVVCDGGSNQHASSAFLGRYVRNNFPMRLHGKDEEETEEANVVGSLCTPTDVIGQKVRLARAEPGDLLIVEKSGAYGLTHSPVLFLSHALPAEILIYRDNIHVLRERGKAEDVLHGQRSLLTGRLVRDDYVYSI
ncbi:MAG: diaminopimelate decarboxylase [Cohnella sp.]|nr:diaminopimelate decarboxylase [Cohnella sp.]